MKMLLEQMCAGGADIVKLAVMPQNMEDVLKLLSVTNEFKGRESGHAGHHNVHGKDGDDQQAVRREFGAAVTFAAHKKRVHQVRWRCMRWLIFWRKCIKLLNKV